MVIYKLTNIITGKVYIGKTVNLKNRLNQHFSRRISSCRLLHRAILKHEYHNFDISLLARDIKNDNLINELERFWIKEYSANNREFGYNLTEGGDGCIGIIVSQEARKKMSVAKLGVKASEVTKQKQSRIRSGRKLSSYHCRRISEGLIGHIVTEETIRKISEANKNNLTYVRTDDHRKLQSLKQKGRLFTHAHRDKIKVARRGQEFTNETRQKISEGNTRRWSRYREALLKRIGPALPGFDIKL